MYTGQPYLITPVTLRAEAWLRAGARKGGGGGRRAGAGAKAQTGGRGQSYPHSTPRLWLSTGKNDSAEGVAVHGAFTLPNRVSTFTEFRRRAGGEQRRLARFELLRLATVPLAMHL